MAAKKPPVIVVPPARQKGRKQNAFNAFVNKHPVLKNYGQWIATYAKDNGIDALFLASVIWAESKGNRNADSGRAAGITQISYENLRKAGKSIEWVKAHPQWAIQYSAQMLGRAYQKYGNYHDTYVKGYNPKDPNREQAWKVIASAAPKGYTWGTSGNVTTPPKTVRQRVGESLEAKQITEAMTHQQFNAEWKHLNDVFYLYTGKNATRQQAAYLIGHGYSDDTLARGLAKTKAFFKSPIYQSHAPDFMEVAKTIYGENLPPGLKLKGLIRQAIINQWDQTAFASKLRESPKYFASNEFKKGSLTLENIYKQMYGNPNQEARHAIQEATLGRWNEDQWTHYLRSLPQYYNSREFRSKQYGIMARLGFAPTQQENPVLQEPGDTLPNSKRIP